MNRALCWHLIGVVLMAVMLTSCTGQPTFRVACLEYSGHTGLKDSDAKMQVLYKGLDIALSAQTRAGTPVDLIVTGEFPTFMGSEDGMENMAQAIPGQRTDGLARIAAEHHVWLIADLLEWDARQDNPKVYNALVVFDRAGRLVAKYRKVRLSPGELERGMQAGTDTMVVDTEFGPVSPMVCWEVQFPDYVSKVMAAVRDRGCKPHLIVHPTAGDFAEELPQIARQYQVTIASAAWDGPSRVIGPDGEILDEQLYAGGKAEEMKLAVADIPCARRLAPTQPDGHRRAASDDCRGSGHAGISPDHER
jgi:predicted amidohydrolase